ncbi:MAG TPA: hypothetical protein VL099_10040 [Candidatus Binatia bacterium]|nr:hypothetical protein [Candidatus Binatia bacterium]
MRRKWYLLGPIVLVLGIVFAAIGGGIVTLLWNWLLPPLFGIRAVSFWQALGLLVLCRMLFGGFGVRGAGRSRVRERIRERMDERWGGITPQEREAWRQRMRERFGFGPPPGEGPENQTGRG